MRLPPRFTVENRKQRIDYVVRVMLRGAQTSRAFDACFEMGDGGIVAASVWKRALKNERLMTSLAKYGIDVNLWRSQYEQGLAQ